MRLPDSSFASLNDSDSNSDWQVKAEQKSSCHLADPLLLNEIASYLVRNSYHCACRFTQARSASSRCSTLMCFRAHLKVVEAGLAAEDEGLGLGQSGFLRVHN